MTVDNSLIEAGRARVAAAAGLRRLSEAKLVKRDHALKGEVVNTNAPSIEDAVDRLSDHATHPSALDRLDEPRHTSTPRQLRR